MRQEKKISFWKRIKISIKDFEIYQEFAIEKPSVAISYFIKLMLLFTICITIVMLYQFSNMINKGLNYFEQNISELSFSQNNLSINKNDLIKIDNSDSMFGKIIIDTGEIIEEKKQEYYQEIKEATSGLVILKDRIVLKNAMLNGLTEYEYLPIAEQYNIVKLEKQDILNFFSGKNIIALYIIAFIIMGIYLFIIYSLTTLVDSVILLILGYIASRLAGMKIRMTAIWNMCIYALTLPILLNLLYIIINSFTGYTIKYFSVMYTTISYIYIITAILMIKSDIIKKQLELAKILAEQKRVREDIKQEETKDEEEQKEDKEDKEEKKEKKDRGIGGQEPEGNNV